MSNITKLNGYDIKDSKARSDIESINGIEMSKIRKENYSPWNYFTLPSIITDTFYNKFNFYTNNKGQYKVEYDLDEFKNSGGTTYYISPTGNSNNDGLTEETAFKQLAKAVTTASSGDTIVVLDGTYDRSMWNIGGTYHIDKSLNIVAKNPGKVFITTTNQDLTFEEVQDHANVYKTTRSATGNVIEILDKNKGEFQYLENVSSLDLVTSTQGSYYKNGDDVYIHLNGNKEVTLDNIILQVQKNSAWLDLPSSFNNDLKLYFYGLIFLDSYYGHIVLNNTTNNEVQCLIKDCKFYNNLASGYHYDAISNLGCKTVCDNVVIINTEKDGFNYHESSSDKQAIGLEINCKCINCGYHQTESSRISNNATTAHDECQAVRVNGLYGYCTGGVVTDISDSKGVVYGCTVFDSTSRNYDIYASNNAVIYVYDSFMKGSSSNYNLLATSTSHVYYKDCIFDNKGSTNVDEIV